MQESEVQLDHSKGEEDANTSSDEALCELLGLASLDSLGLAGVDDSVDEVKMELNDENTPFLIKTCKGNYQREGVCVFPPELSIKSSWIRRITEELVWGGDRIQADRTYETIKTWKKGEWHEKRMLTRLENFVNFHPEWKLLCHEYLRKCISAVLGKEMVLFKEKLNLKPPGGSGFAPHLDSPSLRVALGEGGPTSFVTVMVAIDDMTVKNGCLRFCKGAWSEEVHVEVIEPDPDGSPDAGGRAGAIPAHVSDSLQFEDFVCHGGTIAAFNGWVPHRSAANEAPFPRRAVFLTYNPINEGDFHDRYYEKMEQLRNQWREKVGLAKQRELSEDEQFEMNALATIPTI